MKKYVALNVSFVLFIIFILSADLRTEFKKYIDNEKALYMLAKSNIFKAFTGEGLYSKKPSQNTEIVVGKKLTKAEVQQALAPMAAAFEVQRRKNEIIVINNDDMFMYVDMFALKWVRVY